MIKICSLDFLNKETFEADVLTADGRVLFNSHDKVTPERLLILYFKEIYSKEPLVEKKPKRAALTPEAAKLKQEALAAKSKSTTEKTISGPRSAETAASDKELVAAGPRTAEAFEEATAEATGSGPKTIESSAFQATKKANAPYGLNASSLELSASEVAEEEPEIIQLVFDEELAKRISKHCVMLGEMLKFSKKELNELSQAAYYHDIAISQFTNIDAAKKGFKLMKAHASYETILHSLKLSESIAEAAKSCAYDYDSDAFSLDTQIPYCHIISIVSYYEGLLLRNSSKEATLNKMLQLGGNKFNIFVLHKFLKMMRDTND